MSSSERRKTVRVSFLATWRQEIGAAAFPALRQKLFWLNPLAGGHAVVAHSDLEGITLADSQPVDCNVFVHNVRCGKRDRWLDAKRLIEAPVENLHFLYVVEVIEVADVVVSSRILGKVRINYYSVELFKYLSFVLRIFDEVEEQILGCGGSCCYTSHVGYYHVIDLRFLVVSEKRIF